MEKPIGQINKTNKRNGPVPVSTVLLPETIQRLDAIWGKRGLSKRADAVKEAIADYLQKHERGL
jgi:metal-responsive CopG/Arc/MetJ family transcriptional regulator